MDRALPKIAGRRPAWLVSGRNTIANCFSALANLVGLASRVRKRFGCDGVILELHEVSAPEEQTLKLRSSLTPESLEMLLAYVRRSGWRMIGMDEVHKRLTGESHDAEPFVAFTFDDGYAACLRTALPVFRQYQAPFCANVVVGYLDRTVPHWEKALEALILAQNELRMDRVGGSEPLRVRSLNEKRAALRRLMAVLLDDLRHDRSPLGNFWDRQSADPIALSAPALLSWQDLAELAHDPLVTIGAHTLTHPVLSSLSEERARIEIAQSKAVLERRLAMPVHHFAYPFGGDYACCLREERLVMEAGFKTAITTRLGHINSGHRHNLCSLPRIPVRGPKASTASLRTAFCGLSTLFSSRPAVQSSSL